MWLIDRVCHEERNVHQAPPFTQCNVGVLHAAVWCALLVGLGYGQTSQDQVDKVLSAKVRSVIDSLRQGTYGPATQEQIAEAQAEQLVPILEARFVHSQDVDIKARVAKALVDLGDKGQAYWDSIAQQAKLAIESDAPSSRCFSSAQKVYGFSHLSVNAELMTLRHLDAEGCLLHAFTKTPGGQVAIAT